MTCQRGFETPRSIFVASCPDIFKNLPEPGAGMVCATPGPCRRSEPHHQRQMKHTFGLLSKLKPQILTTSLKNILIVPYKLPLICYPSPGQERNLAERELRHRRYR